MGSRLEQPGHTYDADAERKQHAILRSLSGLCCGRYVAPGIFGAEPNRAHPTFGNPRGAKLRNCRGPNLVGRAP
jgi:hypothetical protein